MNRGRSTALLSERRKLSVSSNAPNANEHLTMKTTYQRLHGGGEVTVKHGRKKKFSDPLDYTYELSKVGTLPEIRRKMGNIMLNPPDVKEYRSKSAPSSPIFQTRRAITRTSSFNSLERLTTQDRPRSVHGTGRHSCYELSSRTPPLSPALRRKLEDTDRIVKNAKMQIEDFRRENKPAKPVQAENAPSLGEAMDEVKSCRYLRQVQR